MLPAALYAYLGHFSRMTTDDYIHFQKGLELGPWENTLYWRNTWSGSYADYFLHSLLARHDTLVPSLTPVAIIAIWCLGLSWLATHWLAFAQVKRHRRALSVSLGAICAAASIHAFYTPQSLYWFSASVRYTLPLALFTLYIALMVAAAKHLRSMPSLALMALPSGVICFIIAGFSEMYLVFQLAALSLLLALASRFATDVLRRKIMLLFGGGWLGALASLGLQATSPGLAIRTDVKLQYEWFRPVRDLPELAGVTLDYMVDLTLQPEVMLSFLLLFAAGMLLSQYHRLSSPPGPADARHQPGWDYLPYLAGLIVQLIFLPVIWSHSSDQARFFGRFSLTFMPVVIANVALILGFLLMIRRSKQLRATLLGKPNRLTAFVLILVMGALAMLAAPRLVAMHVRAQYFLLFTALSLLVLAWWQWTGALTSPLDRRLSWMAAASTLAALLIFAAIVAAGQFSVGQLELRSLSPVSFLLVIQGLVWGFAIGQGIGQISALLRRRIMAVCVVTFLLAYLIIVAGSIRLIPDFVRFAAEWDERHARLLELKDGGETHIEISPRAFDLDRFLLHGVIEAEAGPPEAGADYADPFNLPLLIYYGFESITLTDAP